MWALPLSSGRPLEAWRGKSALAPVAIVAIAGAISSLPTSVTWTLHHGNGGMIGDLCLLRSLASALAPLNGDKAGVAASLILLPAAPCALIGSLRLSQRVGPDAGPPWRARRLELAARALRLLGVGCRGQGR